MPTRSPTSSSPTRRSARGTAFRWPSTAYPLRFPDLQLPWTLPLTFRCLFTAPRYEGAWASFRDLHTVQVSGSLAAVCPFPPRLSPLCSLRLLSSCSSQPATVVSPSYRARSTSCRPGSRPAVSSPSGSSRARHQRDAQPCLIYLHVISLVACGIVTVRFIKGAATAAMPFMSYYQDMQEQVGARDTACPCAAALAILQPEIAFTCGEGVARCLSLHFHGHSVKG